METWSVADSLDVDLDGVERVVVRIVAGEVTVASGGQAHLEVRRDSGDEVHVNFRDGILHVAQPDPQSSGLDRILRFIGAARRDRCSVAIIAPSGCRVEVSTVSASAVVSGFHGGTNVRTVSGEVTLATLGSDLDVKTVSGDVGAKNITADDVKFKTVSGDVALVEGACRHVDAKSVSGDVLLDLDLDPSGTYDFNTVSGNVSLRTTSEPNLSIDLKSVSGRLVSDFGPASSSSKREFRQTIGDGGARLWAKTVSGDLRVLRGREAAA